MTLTLSRNQKRLLASKLSKKYSLNKEYSLKLHEASLLLAEDKVSSAINLALYVAENNQNNVHPWLLLGESALKILDNKMASVFFNRVIDIDAKSALAYLGLAKSFYLNANLSEFIKNYEKSIALNYYEESSYLLYLDVISRLGMIHEKQKMLKDVAEAICSYSVYSKAGGCFLDVEMFDDAARFYSLAYNLDKVSAESRSNYLIFLYLTGKFEEVVSLGESLLEDRNANDLVIQYLLMGYRILKEYPKAYNLIESYSFSNVENEITSRQIISLIYQDQNMIDEAISIMSDIFENYNVKSNNVHKSYGAFLLRERKVDLAMGHWDYRKRNEKKFSSVLQKYSFGDEVEGDLIAVSEQGFGDIIALTPLLLKINNIKGRIKLLCNGRIFELLRGQKLLFDGGIDVVELSHENEMSVNKNIDRYCYLGDLVPILKSEEPKASGYILPNQDSVDVIRNRYLSYKKQKIVGISWRTKNNLSSKFRSVDFEEIINLIPDDYLIVNLQYGDVAFEKKMLVEKYPNKTMVFDSNIDQMTDMKTFIDQVASMDTVITIDNTTAHVCGAVGHPDTHVLIPTGSECMWYWTREGCIDPWYGNLTLNRQGKVGDWSDSISNIKKNI